jgi:hypothetical protein
LDKLDKIPVPILVPGVKSGLTVTALGHTTRGATPTSGVTGSEWRGGACLREQRSSVGSGLADGPLGVEVYRAWLGRLVGFWPNIDLE